MIMKQYIIKGGNPLYGEVNIGGAKNAALGIIVAAIMANEPVTIENLPDVDDVKVLLEAIEGIGAIVERLDRHTVRINGALINDVNVDDDFIRKIQAIKLSRLFIWELGAWNRYRSYLVFHFIIGC